MALGPGVHIFLSRSCHACQRLLDELDQTLISSHAPTHFRYIDRPRPLAVSAAARQNAELHKHQAEVATGVGADPLPYTVVVGDHGLVSRSVTPTVGYVVEAARDAGVRIQVDLPTDSSL